MLPSFIRLLGEWHRAYAFRGPMCSLGNQDIWARHDEIGAYLREAGCQPHDVVPLSHASRTFASDGALAAVSRDFVHARTLFGMLGIEGYVAMDKFDSDRPDVLHDLNQPVPATLHDRFGLLFDGGTAEHIFDVRQVMENIARMTRLGGCVFHIATFRLDHGLYSFSPGFFFDYYQANGFGEFRCALMEVDYGDILRTFRGAHRCIEYRYGMDLSGVMGGAGETLIFFAARKQAAVGAAVVPTQGTYLRRGNLGDAPAVPARSVLERMPRWLRPAARAARPVLRPLYQAALGRRRRRAAGERYL
jgi:hypothetical protein